jgi:hypothetical protein
MNRAILVLLIFVCACTKPSRQEDPKVQPPTPLDPTGTYELVSDAKDSTEEGAGLFGEVRVVLLGDNRIAVGFAMNIGPPSFNSGGFVDTLEFRDSVAVFRDRESDSSCTITLSFAKESVRLTEHADFSDGGCGFGHGVTADGYFRKSSSVHPYQLDPAEGE